MDKHHLFAVKTWGSAISELVCEFTGVPFDVTYFKAADIRMPEYRKINPVGQVPALRLPGGEIMTESLAINLYLNAKGNGGLVPDASHPDYPRFLRWAVFLAANVYALAPVVDHPDWFVTDEAARKELSSRARDRVKAHFLLMEKEARAPFFLGDELSLIDLNLAVMTYWDPGESWFRESTPRLMEIVDRVRARGEFQKVFARNKP